MWSFDLSTDRTAEPQALALSGGRLYVSGDFEGTVDFDPGPGTSSRTAEPASSELGDTTDEFLAAYDAATGDFVWVNQLVTTGGNRVSSDIWEIAAAEGRSSQQGGWTSGADRRGASTSTHRVKVEL